MNPFLAHLKTVLAHLTGHAWGAPAFFVALAGAALVLIFAPGTVARVIFGKDTGLLRTATATLLVLTAALAADAGALSCGADETLAAGAAAAAALAAVWPAGRLLGVPYGQSFGIMLFAVGLTIGSLRGAGYLSGAIAQGLGKIRESAPANVSK